MNEELEYAEMLEIPVSSVNVVYKKNKKREKKEDLQEKLIEKVNGKLASPLRETVEETIKSDNDTLFPPFEETIETQDLSEAVGEKTSEPVKKQSKWAKIVLGTEFACACALCGVVFLTNVFMPSSAINTFFKSFANGKVEQADTRIYSDFTLTNVISTDVELTQDVSPAGILSFTGKTCVYPVADGKISNIEKADDGTYTVTIEHSKSFKGEIRNLSYVSCEVGDFAYKNVPVGYSNGENTVQVMMYDSGKLLNCFTVEKGCPVWSEQSE